MLVSNTRTRISWGAVLVAITLVAVTLLPGLAPQANAKKETRRNYYGAISLNVYDGAWGGVNNARSGESALRNAATFCKRNTRYDSYCRRTVVVRNGCAATSIRFYSNGTVRRWGAAWAGTATQAIRRAAQECGYGCRRYGYVCTRR